MNTRELKLEELILLNRFVSELAETLIGQYSLEETLQVCCQQIVRHLKAAFARIWLLDQSEEVLLLKASAGLYTHLDGGHSRVPVGDFKIGRIARSRKAHLSNSVPTDLEVSDKDWARREGMQSFAGYPLLVEDRLVGVVAMFARHRLSEYQIEALASVSRMIATTVGRKLIEIQLQQNEAELQDFFDNSLVGIQWIAADGIILKANKAALEMLDYREDEYVGRNIVDFHIYKLVLSNILKELGRGVSIRGRQLRLRHKDGSIREVLLDSNALIKDGQFVHARCITRDITEQSYFQKLTRVENEVTNILARSASAEHAIKFIIQYICNQFKWQVGIFWQQNSKEDLQASFVWSSTSDYSSYQIVSTTRRFLINNTVVGRTFRTKEHVWLGDITKDPGYSRAEEAAKNNIKSVLTLPIVLDNKPYGVLEFAGNAISEPDTDLLRILKSVANQIGQYIERMRSAAGLKEQWNLLNNILDNVANGVVASDKNGKMLLFNAHAELILGRGQSESDWREWTREYQLFMDDGVTPYPVDELPLVRAMNGQSVDGIELVVGRDESSKWILVSGRPLIGATGDCYGGVIVFHDITERKENEKRISEFYSMVSHELRTPLTSIRGSLGLLEGRFSADIPPKGAKLVEIARLECDRLVRLINDMLDLRKIEVGKFRLKLVLTEVDSLVLQTISALQGLAHEQGVILEAETSTGVVNCDVDRTKQVLTNLISNAVKFSREGDKVLVRVVLNKKNNCYRFIVEDNGPGIPENKQGLLFNYFEQIDGSDARKGGTGLGLAISKGIVEQHHGTIGLERKAQKGSIFWFELPATQKS